MASTRASSIFRSDTIAQSVGASVLSTAGQQGLGFVRGIALAWVMPLDEFGLYGMALLVINMLLPVCGGGLYEGIARFAPLHEAAGDLRAFIARFVRCLAALSLPMTIVLLVAAPWIGAAAMSAAEGTGLRGAGAVASAPLARASVLCSLTLALFHSMVGLMRGLRMFRAAGLTDLVAAVLFTSMAVGAAMAGGGNSATVVHAYSASNLLTIVLFAPGLLGCFTGGSPAPRTVTAPGSTGALVRYSLWAATGALAWHAFYYYPAWHLLRVSDASTVGSLHGLRLIAQLLFLAAAVAGGVLGSAAARVWEHEGQERALGQLGALSKAAMALLLAGGGALCIAEPLLMRVVPSGVAADRAGFAPLVVFFALASACRLASIRAQLAKRPGDVFLAWTGGLAVAALAGVWLLGAPTTVARLAPGDALVRAAWTGAVGAGAALTILFVLLRRRGMAPDVRFMALAAASPLLGIAASPAPVGVALLLVLAAGGGAVLSKAEFRQVRQALRGSADAPASVGPGRDRNDR